MLRNIRLLYIHNFLSDFFPQWPFLVIYFEPIAGSYAGAMSVLAVETLTSAAMDILTGLFSDRVGRRYTIALGSLSAALGTGFYAAAHGISLLYAGAFFMGLSQCLFSGNNNALLYETLKAEGLESEFHHYRGGTASMYQLALCLSAFAAMFLSAYGLRFVFVIAVIPQILATFVSLRFVEPLVHIEKKQRSFEILRQSFIDIRRNPKLILLIMGKAISYGTGEAGFKFKAAYINMLWPIWAIGLYRGLNHALGFVGYRFSGRIIERVKPVFIFVFRDAYWFVSQMFALFLNNAVTPVIMITGALVFGPGEVASDHLMQIEFTDRQRATMGSLASFSSSIVFAVVAVVMGIVSDHYGLIAGVIFNTCLGLLPLPIYVWLFRKDF